MFALDILPEDREATMSNLFQSIVFRAIHQTEEVCSFVPLLSDVPGHAVVHRLRLFECAQDQGQRVLFLYRLRQRELLTQQVISVGN